jgi:hypothetical protein
MLIVYRVVSESLSPQHPIRMSRLGLPRGESRLSAAAASSTRRGAWADMAFWLKQAES